MSLGLSSHKLPGIVIPRLLLYCTVGVAREGLRFLTNSFLAMFLALAICLCAWSAITRSLRTCCVGRACLVAAMEPCWPDELALLLSKETTDAANWIGRLFLAEAESKKRWFEPRISESFAYLN